MSISITNYRSLFLIFISDESEKFSTTKSYVIGLIYRGPNFTDFEQMILLLTLHYRKFYNFYYSIISHPSTEIERRGHLKSKS